MKSRLEDIIQDLDECIKEDIKVSAQIFGLAAESIQHNQSLLDKLKNQKENPSNNQPQLLPPETENLTEEVLKKRYTTYHEAYEFYQKNYGLICKRGWKHLLKAIQELSSKKTNEDLNARINLLERKVKQLEETVNMLVEIIKTIQK